MMLKFESWCLYLGHKKCCHIELDGIGKKCNGANLSSDVNPLEYQLFIIAEAV